MPNVILNVDDKYKLMIDEIFGPVVCIVPFDTEDEVNNKRKFRKIYFLIYRLFNEQIIFDMVFVVVYGLKMSVELIV
jgi:hypothetical protein